MKDKQGCPDCGELIRTQVNTIALPLKTILNNRFLVGRVLGKPGGFGITYLAWDMLLETTAAIKEFIPLSSVSREPKNITVRANSKQDHLLFKQGLQVFLKEAKILAQFTHPNIVRIRDYFTSNNTAYLVMEYRQGLPLNQVMAQAGGHLSEGRTLEIILPLLDGLEAVHKKGFLHRDIKPQNIYLTDKGVPLLLDFGASRFALTDSTKTLTIMLSSGYAPFEQYHKKGKQGVWSDIYSIGATLYFMSTGKMPADALERQHEDNIIAPKAHNPRLSTSFNQAILHALSVNPKSRPVSIKELKQILLADMHQIAPFKQSVIAPKATLSAPIIKPSNSAVTIRYNRQNNSLSFGRILIYMGIVAILWSGWSTRQMLENNHSPSPQIIIPSPADTEDFTILEEVVYETYEETIDPVGFSPETEMVSTANEEGVQNTFKPDVLINQSQAINIPSPQTIQNQKPPEFPHPIHQPLHPEIPNGAFRACKNKRPHSQCKFNFHQGDQLGLCLPERQGRLACMPRKPPIHSMNRR